VVKIFLQVALISIFSMIIGNFAYPASPTVECVRINGSTFLSGDIIAPSGSILASVCDDVGVATADLYIDSDTGPTALSLSSGTLTKGNWGGAYSIFQGPGVRSHVFTFIMADINGEISTCEMGAVVFHGKVQMVGKALNYPNPFKPGSADKTKNTTKIQYVLSGDSNITLIIYSIIGQEVQRRSFLYGTQGGRAGINTITWNGRSFMNNEIVGNGMYIYKIVSSSTVIGGGKLVVLD
jgi:hypothetical protein